MVVAMSAFPTKMLSDSLKKKVVNTVTTRLHENIYHEVLRQIQCEISVNTEFKEVRALLENKEEELDDFWCMVEDHIVDSCSNCGSTFLYDQVWDAVNIYMKTTSN